MENVLKILNTTLLDGKTAPNERKRKETETIQFELQDLNFGIYLDDINRQIRALKSLQTPRTENMKKREFKRIRLGSKNLCHHRYFSSTKPKKTIMIKKFFNNMKSACSRSNQPNEQIGELSLDHGKVQECDKIKINAPIVEIPNTLVISGGGLKAFYMLGALSRVYEDGLLSHIKYFGGTSVGAIMALSLAIGLTPLDMLNCGLWLPSLNKNTPTNFFSLINAVAVSAHETFEDIMEFIAVMLERKNFKRDVTFIEFSRQTNRELLFIVTKISLGNCVEERYSSIHTPNDSVLKAIRMSCSVPFVVVPVYGKNCIYVDGCLTNNFPVHAMNETWKDGVDRILGIGLDTGRKIDNASNVNYIIVPINRTYGEGLIGSTKLRILMYFYARKAYVKKRFRRHTI